MKKKLTDRELEALGRKLATMHQDAIAVWEVAMATMPIQSQQYRDICSMGRKVQTVYFALRSEAQKRGWPADRVQEVFSSRVACGFS